jgi:hypothetical protein
MSWDDDDYDDYDDFDEDDEIDFAEPGELRSLTNELPRGPMSALGGSPNADIVMSYR